MKLEKKVIGGIVGAIILISACAAAYVAFGGGLKQDAFYPGTTLNGVDVSGLSAEKAKEKLEKLAEEYAINVEFKDETVILDSDTLKLTYNEAADISSLRETQKQTKQSETTEDGLKLTLDDFITYNTEAVTEALAQCDSMNTDYMQAPENAKLVYNKESKSYKLEDGNPGTTLDAGAVSEAVYAAVDDFKDTLNIEAADLYAKAKLTADSEDAASILKDADSYLPIKITYTFVDDETETIDAETIADWLFVDDDLKVDVDQEVVQRLVDQYVEKHSAEKNSTDFTTTSGSVISVNVSSGSETVDANALFEDIMDCLDKKESGEREAPYASEGSGISNNFGGSYIEIDLTNQVLYLYKDGSRVLTSDVVTGSVGGGHMTPTGVYKIYSMERNVTLRGADYASPVSYWMPFNGGVGLHDATWRSSFGGSIYLHNGSHGCINMPLANAKTLFNSINTGYYVIVYGGQSSVSGGSSGSGSTETNKPETNKPETNRPETNKPETNKPETNKPETNKPETNKPETNKPETNPPETTPPETTPPETTPPETTPPETTPPETSAPETSALQMNAPDSTAGK